jgi:hypothetical protein
MPYEPLPASALFGLLDVCGVGHVGALESESVMNPAFVLSVHKPLPAISPEGKKSESNHHNCPKADPKASA